MFIIRRYTGKNFYSHLGTDEDFPESMEFFGGLPRLPIYPFLTNRESGFVVKAVKKVLGTLM